MVLAGAVLPTYAAAPTPGLRGTSRERKVLGMGLVLADEKKVVDSIELNIEERAGKLGVLREGLPADVALERVLELGAGRGKEVLSPLSRTAKGALIALGHEGTSCVEMSEPTEGGE